MAVIWQQVSAGDHYEVRTAGNSIRLYKNRVFHSQWNSERPLSNGVWDLLFLPALFLPAEQVKRVLLLGVGGGAVINQFTHLLMPDKIVGVELDPTHIDIARRFFAVKHKSVELYQADAIDWLHKYKGEKFDIVIEDLFTEENGEPKRVATADKQWFSLLQKHLNPGGALVINFEDPAQMRASSGAYQATLSDRKDIRYQFNQPSYGNSVCAFMADSVSPAALRSRLDQALANYPACRVKGQKFRVRRVV